MTLEAIKVYDDHVEEALINEAIQIIHRVGFRYGWKSSNNIPFSHWNAALSRTGTNSSELAICFRKGIRKIVLSDDD